MKNTAGSVSRARVTAVAAGIAAVAVLAACGSSSSSSTSSTTAATTSSAAASAGAASGKHLKLAYLSFAVANSYDAPMLAAAQAVAADNNASLTVLDANNDPNQACGNLNPCKVGYLYDIKASALDVAIRSSFNAVISSHPNVKIVAEGQDFFTPAQGLTATQNMLQANPDLNLIVASDQGIEGATQAIGKKKVILVGYGGAAAAVAGVSSGAWYGDVAQNPATEGRVGTKQLIDAIRTGTDPAAVNALDDLPASGVMTKANATEFHPEWPG